MNWVDISEPEYIEIKSAELLKEVILRREIVLEVYVGYLLDQRGNYPRSPMLLSSLLRFGTIIVEQRDPGMGEHRHILLQASRKLDHAGYQKLLLEVLAEYNT